MGQSRNGEDEAGQRGQRGQRCWGRSPPRVCGNQQGACVAEMEAVIGERSLLIKARSFKGLVAIVRIRFLPALFH